MQVMNLAETDGPEDAELEEDQTGLDSRTSIGIGIMVITR